MALIKQRPASQIAQLKAELDSQLLEEKSTHEQEDFQQLLLSGPVMVEGQYETFLENRQYVNTWRGN